LRELKKSDDQHPHERFERVVSGRVIAAVTNDLLSGQQMALASMGLAISQT
jgi:hypothetical protein